MRNSKQIWAKCSEKLKQFKPKYPEESTAEQVGACSHGDRRNASPRSQGRMSDAGRVLPGRAPFSLDTFGLKSLLAGESPDGKTMFMFHHKAVIKQQTYCFLRLQVKTYSGHCDSQVHFNVWFDAGAQRVAPDQINGCWRCHVELTLCCFGHQKKRHFNCTGQPR